MQVVRGLLAACLGGLLAWGIVERSHPVFSVPKEYEAPDIGMPPEVYRKNRWARERMERHHAMLYVGLLGALLGGGMVVGTGRGWRRLGGPLLVAVLAASGGVVGGHAASRVHEYVFEHYGQPALQHTLVEQGVLLAPLGLMLGIGWGLATHGGWGLVTGGVTGVLAGVAAALLYPVAVSLLLPGASTDMLLPMERASRGLWFLLVSGLFGAMLPWGTSGRKGSGRAAGGAAAVS